MIFFFQKLNSFSNFEIIIFSMIYYDKGLGFRVLGFIQSVTYHKYHDFQHVNFIFSHKFVSLF